MNGLTTIQSDFGPKETLGRLEAEIGARGMRIFARINHAALAEDVQLPLSPTELVIFGNPRAGTLLMQANQMVGIDLPLKVLVCQDEADNTWLTYDEPVWFAERHGFGVEMHRVIGMMALSLNAITKKATEIRAARVNFIHG